MEPSISHVNYFSLYRQLALFELSYLQRKTVLMTATLSMNETQTIYQRVVNTFEALSPARGAIFVMICFISCSLCKQWMYLWRLLHESLLFVREITIIILQECIDTCYQQSYIKFYVFKKKYGTPKWYRYHSGGYIFRVYRFRYRRCFKSTTCQPLKIHKYCCEDNRPSQAARL